MAKSRQMAVPAGQTSLERLKALDTLPDLQAQLKEARQSCTHSARADMLAKWLLAKIQSDADARASPESWSILELIIRISPPERLATLLGISDLIQTVTKTATEIRTSTGAIGQIEKCLSLLLSLPDGAKSAAVQARLSTSAEKAAEFLGAWFRALVQAEPDLQRSGRLESCVEQGVRIWTLRKHDPQENEHFATQCLVPAAALLCTLESTDPSSSIQRKRKIDGASQVKARSCLEALLAKHVFLPARTAFFATVPQKQSRFPSAIVAATIPLTQRLSAMANGVESGELRPGSVSRLLDIGLRSAPVHNSRQRLKEKPWVENMFSALLACLASVNLPSKQRALTGMLQVLQANSASLSKDTLLQLATDYAVPENDQQSTNWELLGQMISLDPTMFARVNTSDKHLDAAKLFDLVSLADYIEGEDKDYIRERVVVPIMRAFANNRMLPAFIDLWSEQLQRTHTEESVWLRLRSAFAVLVEGHLASEYIIRWIKDLRDSIDQVVEDADNVDLHHEGFNADATIVSTMLCGLHSAEYRDAIYGELDEFAHQMFSIRDNYLKETYNIWFLLRHILELWFPAWAVRQSDRALVVERAGKIYATNVQASAERHLALHVAGTSKDGTALAKVRDICHYLVVAAHLLGEHDPRFMDACKTVGAKVNDGSILAVALSSISELSKEQHVKRPTGSNVSLSGLSDASKDFASLLNKAAESSDQLDPKETVQAVAESLDSNLSATEYSHVVAQFSHYCQSAKSAVQLGMLHRLLDSSTIFTTSTMILTKAVLTNLRRDDFTGDPPLDVVISPQSVTSRLLAIAKQSTSLSLVRGSLDCVALALRSKPVLTNQSLVEATVTTLKCLAEQNDSRLRALYLDICSTLTALLQHHRSRLRDRMHLMVELLQSLISCIFRRLSASDGNSKRLTARHARLLARNLQLLCNPPRLIKTRTHTSDLVDEARKAQAHVGQYMQYVLHHYCVEVLGGTPGEGVREALMPGIYAMIEAMEVGNDDAIKVLGAAMNNSERAVLRSVYDDYSSFAKWRGG